MSHHDNPEHAEATLRLLATRLLEVDTTAVAGGDEVQLLPGQLPHDLPVEVPLPLGAAHR